MDKCDVEDGRIVGHLLMELVQSKPKDPAHAIRTFTNRTAMLKESGLHHIGEMLVALLMVDAKSNPDDILAVAVAASQDPSSLTREQASAIGHMIASSIFRSHESAAVDKAVELHPVLSTMKLQHAWFVPMLEVLVAANAVERRRSNGGKRFSSIIAPEPTERRIDVTPKSASAEFDSVVRLKHTS